MRNSSSKGTKRISRTAAVGTLLLAGPALLAACSSSGGTSSSSNGQGTTNGSQSKPNLVFIEPVAANPYWSTMVCGMEAEATKLGGVNLNIQAPPQYDPTLQIPVVTSITAKKPTGVFIAPASATALIPSLKTMQSAGIPIVQVDSPVTDSSVSIAEVYTNNEQGGVVAADELAKLINYQGDVYIVGGPVGISSEDARITGFQQEMKKYHNINVVGIQYAGEDASKAASIADSALSAYPDLKGFFTLDQYQATGASSALQAAHKAKGAVKIVTFDATPPVVSNLLSNVIQSIISQDPYEEGVIAMEDMMLHLHGKPVVASVSLTTTKALTAENVHSPSSKPYLYQFSC